LNDQRPLPPPVAAAKGSGAGTEAEAGAAAHHCGPKTWANLLVRLLARRPVAGNVECRKCGMPEMWKTRPVVVLSYKNTLHGPCLVVPTTTDPQGNSPWAWELSISIDGRRNRVICNHLYTVAPSRLSPEKGRISRVPNVEFNEILKRVTAWLPRPFELDK
jgi:mRNA-degrading endonuclease toxin of MazEF toxin-antitoxin module